MLYGKIRWSKKRTRSLERVLCQAVLWFLIKQVYPLW